jgi:hypothetical protein
MAFVNYHILLTNLQQAGTKYQMEDGRWETGARRPETEDGIITGKNKFLRALVAYGFFLLIFDKKLSYAQANLSGRHLTHVHYWTSLSFHLMPIKKFF